MKIRTRLIAPWMLFCFTALLPYQAHASLLLGNGKTVQAFYYNGVFASPEGEIAMGQGSSNPVSLTNPVTYTQGAADGSSIQINDTQIIITNLLNGVPFCFANTPGTACTDQIDGFDIKFTGENIGGVTVNGISALDFQPVSGTFQSQTHLGLQLISPNEIRIDVTGDAPALNHALILDIVAGTPEPSTLLLTGFGMLLAGIAVPRVRNRRE